MRANIVVAVGVMGERADLEKFSELVAEDFGKRAEKIAGMFGGRIEILPLPEVENEV